MEFDCIKTQIFKNVALLSQNLVEIPAAFMSDIIIIVGWNINLER